MAPQNIDKLNCSVAQALDLIGEGWTILILREAFFGSRRFDEFQKQLGVARNILTVRLNKLCENGILEKRPIKDGAKRHEYRLTAMGKDLYSVLIAITQWGDRWLRDSKAPVKFIERKTGKEVAEVTVFSEDGKKLKPRELAVSPGPGATAETIARLQSISDRTNK